MKTVFVAMSGGIDSSIAAYLLKKEGFNVVGITFRLLPKSHRTIKNPMLCCSSEAIDRAKRVADTLFISHYIVDFTKEFEEKVIERFISEYKKGRTPNPCIFCNQSIKFSSFFDKALSMGGDFIATGHYARIEQASNGYCLKRGVDKTKDQSYFLYQIKQDRLERILFPIGWHTKKAIMTLVHEVGWDNALNYKESQDICFIPNGEYRSFLSHFVRLEKGPIYFVDGKFLGHHEGIHQYTVGQRRGINVPYSEPLYVIEKRPYDNSLVVGPKIHLVEKKLIAREVNLLSDISHDITGKVRYRQKEQPCTFSIKDNIMEVEFDQAVDAITPGQSVVLYSHDIVVGGGIIEKSAR